MGSLRVLQARGKCDELHRQNYQTSSQTRVAAFGSTNDTPGMHCVLYLMNNNVIMQDIFHLCHVARCISPQISIQHNYPGATYTVPDPHPINEKKHAEHLKDVIKSRYAQHASMHIHV